jgi:hypothetical protein
MTCAASGTAAEGWYYNTGSVSGDYTDSEGNEYAVTDSDDSSYYGLTPGAVTNSSLCDFGDQFNLVFTPDMQSWPGHYKLSDSNPGQFFYNLFYIADGSGTASITLPYPFVTQGAMPVHAYTGVFVTGNGETCFTPVEPGEAYDSVVSLSDYDPLSGYDDTYVLNLTGLPTSGFVYLNIHLDYGLEKTKGWEKSGDNALYDAADFDPSYPDIMNLTSHPFDSSIPDSSDAISNLNVFKRIKGFGGLVLLYGTDEPVVGAQVNLYGPDGWIETMTTDENGWYQSEYVHKGKEAVYTLTLLSSGDSQSVTVGKSVKFGGADYYVTP